MANNSKLKGAANFKAKRSRILNQKANQFLKDVFPTAEDYSKMSRQDKMKFSRALNNIDTMNDKLDITPNYRDLQAVLRGTIRRTGEPLNLSEARIEKTRLDEVGVENYAYVPKVMDPTSAPIQRRLENVEEVTVATKLNEMGEDLADIADSTGLKFVLADTTNVVAMLTQAKSILSKVESHDFPNYKDGSNINRLVGRLEMIVDQLM